MVNNHSVSTSGGKEFGAEIQAAVAELCSELFGETDVKKVRDGLRLCKLSAFEHAVALQVKGPDGSVIGYTHPFSVVVKPISDTQSNVNLEPAYTLYAVVTSVPDIEIPTHAVYAEYEIIDGLATQWFECVLLAHQRSK